MYSLACGHSITSTTTTSPHDTEYGQNNANQYRNKHQPSSQLIADDTMSDTQPYQRLGTGDVYVGYFDLDHHQNQFNMRLSSNKEKTVWGPSVQAEPRRYKRKGEEK